MTGMGASSGSSFSHLVTSRPRDLRQLDVHQDQVGPVLARQADRLHAAPGLQGLVAMRFEQIMKELHVQLIILDDQNLFLHLIPPRRPPMPKGPIGPKLCDIN